MGIGQYFREQNPNIKLFPMEPASSQILSTGHKAGKHRHFCFVLKHMLILSEKNY